MVTIINEAIPKSRRVIKEIEKVCEELEKEVGVIE